jgi:hypothetical protein
MLCPLTERILSRLPGPRLPPLSQTLALAPAGKDGPS